MTTRNIAYTLLALCLLCGLIAGIFSHPIEAALTLPQMNAALPTPAATQAPGAIPTTPIAPSPAANAPNTLARDTFQRPDQLFWGKASDGQLWTGDANGSDTFSIVRNAGQVNGQPGVYTPSLGLPPPMPKFSSPPPSTISIPPLSILEQYCVGRTATTGTRHSSTAQNWSYSSVSPVPQQGSAASRSAPSMPYHIHYASVP